MTTETRPPRLGPRIIDSHETGRLDLALPPVPEEIAPEPPRRRRLTPFRVALIGFAVLVGGVAAIDLVRFVGDAYQHGAGFGIVAAATVAAGIGGGLYWLGAELRGLLRLRSVERLQALIPLAEAGALKREIAEAATVLARDPQLTAAVARYRAVIEPHHTGRDALELFGRFVLVPADRLAQAAIRRASGQAFAINLISPTAVIDTLLFAARATRLVREIAQIYGQRPGFAGTVRLLRRIASGAGLVGAVDLVGGMVVQQLGGAVLERLSASAAESAYAAQKMARLGLVAMALCRPLEFRPGEVPSLTALVSGAFKRDATRDG
jgi:putative membrane protein